MNTLRRVAVLVASALLVIGIAVPAGAKQDTTPGLPVMVGLGDSWTFGQGAADPATEGYLALTHLALQDDRTVYLRRPSTPRMAVNNCSSSTLPDRRYQVSPESRPMP